MRFHRDTALVFVPDDLPFEAALARTTHLAIGAHPDDLEIMAAAPILDCFQRPDRWFTGVVVTDGRGSPRDDLYREFTDDAMRQVRLREQKKAAVLGDYSALVMLDYPSRAVRDGADQRPTEDITALLLAARPEFVYVHNLVDKHDTHVGTALKVVAALRSLPAAGRPQLVVGCEVWRDLDWMVDADKVALDVSMHPNLQAALLGVFDSQICGGKRYDLATMGRRRANATYFESHGVDVAQGLTFAMDLTPLVSDPQLDIGAFVQAHIARFARDVADRLRRVG